jgi:hypothetical protein
MVMMQQLMVIHTAGSQVRQESSVGGSVLRRLQSVAAQLHGG